MTVEQLALRIHASLYERTNGLIGHRLLGVPTLLLRTTGRRTGQTRTNALVYARDDSRFLIVPSNGGADRSPAWLHNLRAQPQVEFQIGSHRRRAKAEIIDRDAPDFPRLWKAVNDNNRGRYDTYQSKTSRPILVVALTPEN